MHVSLGTQGQPGFDEPLALMSDCHRRIEHFLSVLVRVADRQAGDVLDEQTQAAMRAAQRYFRESAPLHTADEEHSLFPRLSALGPDLADLINESERLEREHKHASRLHASVDRRIEQWLSSGVLAAEDIEALREELRALDTLYARHIAFEDQTLFPRAQRVLAGEELLSIGREMAARRGLSAAAIE